MASNFLSELNELSNVSGERFRFTLEEAYIRFSFDRKQLLRDIYAEAIQDIVWVTNNRYMHCFNLRFKDGEILSIPNY